MFSRARMALAFNSYVSPSFSGNVWKYCKRGGGGGVEKAKIKIARGNQIEKIRAPVGKIISLNSCKELYKFLKNIRTN